MIPFSYQRAAYIPKYLIKLSRYILNYLDSPLKLEVGTLGIPDN
jgi:hypothetical protein